MEGRFEDFTLGRNIEMEKVKEIYHLFRKHGFQIAGLSSFGKYLTDEDLAQKRALAECLRGDPELFARIRAEAAEGLARIPPSSKGVKTRKGPSRLLAALGTLLGAVLLPGRRVKTSPAG